MTVCFLFISLSFIVTDTTHENVIVEHCPVKNRLARYSDQYVTSPKKSIQEVWDISMD